MNELRHLSPSEAEISKWVKVLRSGKYNQGHGVLNSNNSYCCLGLACKIFIPDRLLTKSSGSIEGLYPSEQINSPEWLTEINNSILSVIGHPLANLNDGDISNELNMVQSHSFDEIADILELVYFHAKLLPLRK